MPEKTEKTEKATRSLPRKEAKCSIEGCKRPYRAKKYCNVHYRLWRTGQLEGHHARYKTCNKEGCLKAVKAHGLCEEHGKHAEAAPAK